MSADNGIYILKTKGEWRVVLAQCIDNLYFWKDDETGLYLRKDDINPQELVNYFYPCNVLKSEYEAMEEAQILYDELMDDDFCPILEYGICYVTGWEDKYFPVDLEPEEFNDED
jgi:hypothetical protein